MLDAGLTSDPRPPRFRPLGIYALYPHPQGPYTQLARGADVIKRNEKPALARIELLQGTLDLIVLQTLRWGSRHGYGLVQMIDATTRGVLQVDAGAIYPALHRLERQKLVKAEWTVSENRQRVRVYRL